MHPDDLQLTTSPHNKGIVLPSGFAEKDHSNCNSELDFVALLGSVDEQKHQLSSGSSHEVKPGIVHSISSGTSMEDQNVIVKEVVITASPEDLKCLLPLQSDTAIKSSGHLSNIKPNNLLTPLANANAGPTEELILLHSKDSGSMDTLLPALDQDRTNMETNNLNVATVNENENLRSLLPVVSFQSPSLPMPMTELNRRSTEDCKSEIKIVKPLKNVIMLDPLTTEELVTVDTAAITPTKKSASKLLTPLHLLKSR